MKNGPVFLTDSVFQKHITKRVKIVIFTAHFIYLFCCIIMIFATHSIYLYHIDIKVI